MSPDLTSISSLTSIHLNMIKCSIYKSQKDTKAAPQS